MARVLHLFAIVCLVAAAVVVYKVKYGSTYEAQHSAKLRAEIPKDVLKEPDATLQERFSDALRAVN